VPLRKPETEVTRPSLRVVSLVVVKACALAISALVGAPASASATGVPLSPGEILVTAVTAVGTPIFRIDPATGNRELVIEGTFPDFAIGPDRMIYAIEGTEIVQIDPASGNKETIASGDLLANPGDIGAGDSGETYVLDRGALAGVGAIIEVDSLGNQSVLSTGGHIGGEYMGGIIGASLAMERVPGGDLFVLNFGAGVFSVSVSTGLQSPLTQVILEGTGLGVALDGGIHVADFETCCIRFPPGLSRPLLNFGWWRLRDSDLTRPPPRFARLASARGAQGPG
jgi:hypothetical protein